LLLSRGHHPKLVQELLGHSSVAMTLDRYSHGLPGMGDQTAAAMEAALSWVMLRVMVNANRGSEAPSANRARNSSRIVPVWLTKLPR
jgi:hypothetical protein